MEAETTDIICDVCGKNMIIKEGKFGRFLGCSGYPECKNTKPIDTGVKCPREGCGGSICERLSRKGKNVLWMFKLSELHLCPVGQADTGKMPPVRTSFSGREILPWKRSRKDVP